MRNPFRRIRDLFRKPAMVGTPPSQRPMWHNPVAHTRDFAERYADPMNYLVENRMLDPGIHSDRIGARKYGYPHRAFWPEENTGGGNVTGRRITADSGVFNIELMANNPETMVRRVLAEFPGVEAERKDGYMVLPWHGLGSVEVSEAFALRLHELTGCLIADRRNGRLIDPEVFARKKRAAV